MEMDTSGLELDAEVDTGLPNSQTRLVRKNISLKLKGKGKGGRGGRGGGGGRGRGKKATAARNAPVSENEPEEVVVPPVTAKTIENEGNTPPPKIEYDEEDLFNMEAPTFTTIDRGPPEPMHRNVKLRWDYDVNLIGQKVLNPTIHVCQKCNIPILLYGRMIPCKHVFCHDCAKKADKICPRCNDKVSRVEQTGLGTLFMCEHGGAKRNDSQACLRTYLSQRDLQAHMNHRHLQQATPSSTVPSSTTTTPQSKSLDTVSRTSSLQHGQSQHQPPPLMPPSHHHSGHHQISASNPSSSSQQVDYRRGHTRSHMQQPPPSDLSSYRTPSMSVPPPMTPYSTDHRTYDRTGSMVTSTPMALAHQQPPPGMSAYALAMVSQQSQVAQLGVPPIYGTSQIQVVNPSAASTVTSNRTNLITVPIHDDSSNAGMISHAADYLYNPHQMPPPPPQQQNYMPPIIPSPYTTPPPISYGAPNSYGSGVVTTAFPPPQAPPPTHYPPPTMYSSQPPNIPPPPIGHHQGLPPRYSAPPTPRYPTQQYEDHTHLGSPSYPPPTWNMNPPPQHPNVPPPLTSLAPPQSRPPFYH